MRRGFSIIRRKTWIDSEKLYEVLYSFEMEGVGNADIRRIKSNLISATCITR